MSDTGLADTPIPQPPSRLEQIKGFIGDLARPIAIISSSVATSVAIVIIALRVQTFEGGAIFIGAAFTGVATLYGAKAWENAKAGQQAADVEKVKASAPSVPT